MTYTYHLLGRILGGTLSVSIKDALFDISVKNDQGEFIAILKCCQVTVDASHVEVTVKDVDSSVDSWLVQTHAQRLVHLIAVAQGAIDGIGVNVVIDSMWRVKDLEALCEVPLSQPQLSELEPRIAENIRKLITGDPNCNPKVPYLRRSVSDYVWALREAQDAFTACFRAIESVRLFFQEQYKYSKGDSWIMLKRNLNIDPCANKLTFDYDYDGFAVGWLTDKAVKTRHGSSGVLSKEEYNLALTSAKTVIERFTCYDIYSQKVAEFPTLEPVNLDIGEQFASTSGIEGHVVVIDPPGWPPHADDDGC